MDPRRLLSAVALTFALGGCALLRNATPPQWPLPMATASLLSPAGAAVETPVAPLALDPAPEPERPAIPPPSTARPYLATPDPEPEARRPIRARGRSAIAAANRQARAASSGDAFTGGVQVFAWDPGRVYEVWTAPLRVTALTLAPGETVTAKAAGDTVRWQIGESLSGAGGSARTHVLIKPLQAGLETNLVLTTSQRVYLLSLRSGDAEAFNAAIAWDYGASTLATTPLSDPSPLAETLPPVDVAAVTPQGPLDARYRIEARGRPPRWAPTAVFNDGVRTFITLSPDVAVDEAPALFVLAGGEAQLVNYRQADGLLIVDRVFDEAELRLGDRRPRIVHIRRLTGAAR